MANKTIEKRKEYRKTHKDIIKKSFKRWYNSVKGRANRLLKLYTRMDEKNGFGNVIDFDVKWMIENIMNKPCIHCGETDWHELGCNRIDNSKPHTKDNVEPCCYKCNVKLASDALKKQVYQYTLDGELVKVWNSTRECGRNGFNQSAVAKCCNGGFNYKGRWINCKIFKGYKWSYSPL